ncbi:MAG: DNA polymerase III subunit beta [Armatimonadota bacterium]|nr:DNA polymerase III subunit beta [Armatimonadota bacterium]
MQFTCGQDQLNRAVGLVGRAVSTRATMPILGNVLLETRKETVKLAATDLDHGIQTEVGARIARSGAITLPARLFAEIVANLPPADVQITVAENGTEVRVQCETVTYDLIGLPATDFPLMPEPEVTPVASVDSGLLRTMVRQTAFAVSTDETRVFLTGLYLVLDDKEIRLVATDGGRLALRIGRLARAATQKVGVIVPAKTMHELSRALIGVEGGVEIFLAENQILFTTPAVRVISRLIPGPFPNYQQVIPQSYKQRVTVGTERFLAAVRRVALTARDSANVVRLHAEGGVLVLVSSTPEYGRAEERVVVSVEGETVVTAFNARYLVDCLAVLETDELVLELTGPLSPGVFRPAGQSDYTYVLAPVRVAA